MSFEIQYKLCRVVENRFYGFKIIICMLWLVKQSSRTCLLLTLCSRDVSEIAAHLLHQLDWGQQNFFFAFSFARFIVRSCIWLHPRPPTTHQPHLPEIGWNGKLWHQNIFGSKIYIQGFDQHWTFFFAKFWLNHDFHQIVSTVAECEMRWRMTYLVWQWLEIESDLSSGSAESFLWMNNSNLDSDLDPQHESQVCATDSFE